MVKERKVFTLSKERKMTKEFNLNKKNILKIIGLIAIGIVMGMVLSWVFIYVSVDSFVNNILPNIHIENIVFDLNETALVEGMNESFESG